MFYLLDGHDDAIPMICPEGLWYNPRICSCDWLIAGKGVQKSKFLILYSTAEIKLFICKLLLLKKNVVEVPQSQNIPSGHAKSRQRVPTG